MVKNPPANAGAIGDVSSIPGWGRSSGGGNGNSFQYSCMENSMDKGVWQATVMGSQKVRHNWASHYKYIDVCVYIHTYIYSSYIYEIQNFTWNSAKLKGTLYFSILLTNSLTKFTPNSPTDISLAYYFPRKFLDSFSFSVTNSFIWSVTKI